MAISVRSIESEIHKSPTPDNILSNFPHLGLITNQLRSSVGIRRAVPNGSCSSKMASIDRKKLVTQLGSSGLKINPIVVGVMFLGTEGTWMGVTHNKEEGLEALKKCYDAGLRTFDTADAYTNGKSEELLGLFIKKYNIPREKIVILTKGYFPVIEGSPGMDFSEYDPVDLMNAQGLSRKHILDAAKASYERLGTYADVYQIHRNDTSIKPEEIMRGLNDVVEKGYARYIGSSSMKTHEFVELQMTARIHGWHEFVSMQSYYSLLYREDERELNDYCSKHGIGIIPWSPLARGVLARPSSSEKNQWLLGNPIFGAALGIQNWEEDVKIIDRVEELSKKLGYSMSQVCLAWLLHKGANPIAGLSNSVDINELVAATQISLSDEDITYLEELYKAKAPALMFR